MKKLLTASVLAFGCLIGAAQAAPIITFTPGGSGSAAGTTAFQTFDQYASGTSIGTNTTVYSASTTNASKPLGASGNYAATGANGSYTATFAPSSIFSFVLGSLDSYNELILNYADGTLAADLVGSAITGGTGTANSSTTSTAANGLVTYTVTSGPLLGSATFKSGTTPAFEYDTLSASAVPEPAAWGMMILGFALVGGALRRRPSAKVRFA